jgi:hypothetical protein
VYENKEWGYYLLFLVMEKTAEPKETSSVSVYAPEPTTDGSLTIRLTPISQLTGQQIEEEYLFKSNSDPPADLKASLQLLLNDFR